MLKAKKVLGSKHCVSFFMERKEDFNVFGID